VCRIHLSEFAFRNSFLKQFADTPVDRLKIGFDQSIDMQRAPFARSHHLALHQFGINLVGGDEIEIRSDISHDLIARRQIAVENCENASLHPGKRIVEHRTIKCFLVLEVVVEECLVDSRLVRNGVSAGSGDAVLGKLLRCGPQNSGTAFLGLAAGTHAGKGATLT